MEKQVRVLRFVIFLKQSDVPHGSYPTKLQLNLVSFVFKPYLNCHYWTLPFSNHILLNPMSPSDAAWKQKFILEDLFSSALSQSKIYHPSGNLKFNYLATYQSLKLRFIVEKFF